MTVRPTLNETKEYREGYEAASRSERYAEACPYTFQRSGCMDRPFGQEQFDLEYHPKMNDWFNGWKAWLDERGLGFNFKPKRKAVKK